MESPMPTNTAVIALGIRKFHRIISQLSLLMGLENKLRTTSSKGMLTEPKLTFVKNRVTVARSNSKKRNVCFWVIGIL
jgi:hypothetical protein